MLWLKLILLKSISCGETRCFDRSIQQIKPKVSGALFESYAADHREDSDGFEPPIRGSNDRGTRGTYAGLAQILRGIDGKGYKVC